MIKVGDYLGKGKNKKKVLEIVQLSNAWILVKTENSKSKNDFKVRTIYEPEKLKFYTPKHAHFALDFYGKLCNNSKKTEKVFKAIIEVWKDNSVKSVLKKYLKDLTNLPGYNLDYILYALKWILEQKKILIFKEGRKNFNKYLIINVNWRKLRYWKTEKEAS